MSEELKFQVTGNHLHDTDYLKYLEAANDAYDVVIFYYGEYDNDIADNHVLTEAISIRCKPKYNYFGIKYMAGMIYIDLSLNQLLSIDKIDDYKNQLDVTKQSALALVDLLREYKFPAEI